jgi:sensor histidine kinase YesM
MLKKASKYYWWCQIGGWASYWVFMMVVAYTYNQNDLKSVVERTFYVLTGLLITHLLRAFILSFKWLQYSLDRLIWRLLLALAFCSLAIILLLDFYNIFFHFLSEKEKSFQLFHFLSVYLLLLIWTLIYILWHYFQKDQQYKMDQLKLEATVKELELKTIKSQLNPHFIFNALNSIRALIDENPSRARNAITELSNILRNSMQAEKVETVTLENEISIVKDYLALEHIRFEERLQVQYDIEPDTLELPIPPMMLQTLVENAIKHGISKEVSGGIIYISSRIKGMNHEITVENTGHIESDMNEAGFGLQSTRQRLEILFGKGASFEIINKADKKVEARVLMPLV